MKKWLQDVWRSLKERLFGAELTKEQKLHVLTQALLGELEEQGYDLSGDRLRLVLLWVGEDYLKLESSTGRKWKVSLDKYQGREENSNAILSSKVSP